LPVWVLIEAVLGLLIIFLLYRWTRTGAKQQTPASPTDTLPAQPRQPKPVQNPQPSPSWNHAEVDQFYRRYIAPHTEILTRAGYLQAIEALLTLLDRYGDCPSVVRFGDDREYEEFKDVYDLLAKVTLLQHSLNVAEQMVAAIQGRKDPELLLGKILTAALGHDIGKIRELIEGHNYSKGDHAYLSYLILKRAILTAQLPQQKEILQAVREHHYPVKEGFTYQLRQADHHAREYETETLSAQGHNTSQLVRVIEDGAHETAAQPSREKGTPPQTLDLSWLDLDRFLNTIDPLINRKEPEVSLPPAFSMNNGLVYLIPDLVSDTVIELAREAGHSEIMVGAETKDKRRRIEYTVKTMLAERDLIPSFIGEGYSGARFAIITRDRKKTAGFYMAVKAEAFKTPLADLEKRKNNASFFSNIAEVKPLIPTKK